MSQVFEVDPARTAAAAAAIDAAASAVRGGGLVVLPTETVYGIASRPDDPKATARIFAAKRRPRGLTLPVLAPTSAAAFDLGLPTPVARTLVSAFWPGPLTLVLDRTAGSASWELGGDGDTIGLRVPDHELTAALLDRAGPLAATSANRSGRLPIDDPDELVRTFDQSAEVILLLAADAEQPTGSPSTVVDARGSRPRVLRRGAIGAADLRSAVAGPTACGTR